MTFPRFSGSPQVPISFFRGHNRSPNLCDCSSQGSKELRRCCVPNTDKEQDGTGCDWRGSTADRAALFRRPTPPRDAETQQTQDKASGEASTEMSRGGSRAPQRFKALRPNSRKVREEDCAHSLICMESGKPDPGAGELTHKKMPPQHPWDRAHPDRRWSQDW